MKLNIAEAARRAGVDRKVIYRKISAGELSKEVGADGKPVIDLSELARVYPQAVTPNVTPETVTSHTLSPPENDIENRLLQVEVDHLRQRLGDMERRAETAEADKAALRDQLAATTRLLTDQRQKAETAEQAEEIDALQDRLNQLEKRGFWNWFFGRDPAPPPRRPGKSRR